MLLSEDKGLSWTIISDNLPYTDSIPFAYGEKLYLFFMVVPSGELDERNERMDYKKGLRYTGINVIVSEDEGRTWSEPIEVIEGIKKYSTCQIPMVIKDGYLYWAISEGPFERMAVASCKLNRGILNPAAWNISEGEEMNIPKELNPGFFPGPSMHCLEGNVVQVEGRLRVLARAVIDRQGTANIAAAFDISVEDGRTSLSFTQFVALPGGQCKFHIIYDEVSKLFWMASNVPSNSQNWIDISAETASTSYLGGPGNDRRFLMLWYACDALNWFPAGCIARAERLTQSFMYPTIIIDGEDLAVISRTSRDAIDQHDADLATFHRIHDFRRLAMDIWPNI